MGRGGVGDGPGEVGGGGTSPPPGNSWHLTSYPAVAVALRVSSHASVHIRRSEAGMPVTVTAWSCSPGANCSGCPRLEAPGAKKLALPIGFVTVTLFSLSYPKTASYVEPRSTTHDTNTPIGRITTAGRGTTDEMQGGPSVSGWAVAWLVTPLKITVQLKSVETGTSVSVKALVTSVSPGVGWNVVTCGPSNESGRMRLFGPS